MLPLRAHTLSSSGEQVDAEPAGELYGVVRDFLRGRDRRGGLVVLGSFGSGKTLLCDTLARSQRRCTAVPLRVVARAPSVEEGLLRVVGRTRLSEARAGERILLLDGFDEVPRPEAGYPSFFEDLVGRVGPRWVLTSRPGHFRTEGSGAADQVDSLSLAGVQTLCIEPLSRDQVREVLAELPDGERLLDSVAGLAETATAPVLLHAVHGARPWILFDKPIQPWGVFDAWMRNELAGGDDEVMARLQELCWANFQAMGRRVEVTHLVPELLRRARLPDPVRRALLVTDLDGHVRFGHRSLYEFLISATLAPRIAENQGRGPDELSGLRITEAIRAFVVGRCTPMPVRIEAERTRVPRGNFIAGGDLAYDERPLRIEHLSRAVWVARSPVTHRDWAAFLTAVPDSRIDANYLRHWGPERKLPAGSRELPIYHLWPEDADRYAAWRGARLPTADEWEKAVRGVDGRRYPWGDHWRPGLAVTAETGVHKPLPVRALGAQGVSGLFSASGGVFEYVSDRYGDQDNRGRVVMGGCFTHPAATARVSLRLSHKLSGHLKAGLRLAWSDDEGA